MSLQIEILPDLAAAEQRLTRLVAERPSPLTRLNVLFGSSLQRIDSQRRLAQEFGGGLAAIYGFTPVDLAQAVAVRGQSPPRRSWPRGADLVAIRELLARIQLQSFDPATPGLPQALLRSFTDLREAALDPEDLPGGDLRTAYTAWREIVDSTGDRTAIYEDAVSDATSVAAYREALGDAPLIVTGISDLTRIQRLLLQRCAEAVEVHMLIVDPVGASSEPSIPLDTAKLLATEADGEIMAAATQSEPLADAECFSSGDSVGEAEEIARRILELARGGVPFQRIAVLHQQGAAADEQIRSALERARIPVWLIAGHPVVRSPAGRATRDLLRLLLADRDRVERVALLDTLAQSGLADRLPIGPHGVIRQPQQWERLADATSLVRGWIPMHARLERWLGPDRDGEGAGAGLLEVLGDLGNRAAQIEQAQTWTEAADLITEALDTYLAQPLSDEATEGPSSRDAAISAIDRLRSLDRSSLTYTTSAALAAALRALGGEVVRDRKRLIGGVNVGAAHGPARGIGYDAIFVAGCAERVFPATGRQDPLLPDDTRALVNQRVAGALALQSGRAESDRHIFRLLRQAARQRFVVSWARRSSAIGGPSRASSLLLEAASEPANQSSLQPMLGSEEDLTEAGRLLRMPAGVSGIAPNAEQAGQGDWSGVLRALDLQDLRLALLAAPDVRREPLLHKFWPEFGPAQDATRARNQPRFTEYDGQITSATDPDPLDRSWSAHELQTYVRCPYRFFVEHVLEIESVDDRSIPDLESERDRLVAGILTAWVSRWLNGGADDPQMSWPDYCPASGELQIVAEHALTEARTRGLLGPEASAAQVHQEVLNNLDRVRRREVADARDGWTPLGVQQRYDGAKLNIGGGRSVRLRGRLGRIDSHADGRLRAVRYTSGALNPGVDGFRNGSVLGPVADLSALLPALQERGGTIDLAEVELRSMSARGEFGSQTLRGADFTRRGGASAPTNADDLLTTFGTIVAGIEAGTFIANVGEPAIQRPHCRRCPVEAGCTPDIGRRTAFKARGEPERIRALATLRRKRVTP